MTDEEQAPGSRRFQFLLERERSDMAWLVHAVAALYDEVSGGRISKPMTYPSEVVGVFNERLHDAAGEGVRDFLDDVEAVLRSKGTTQIDLADLRDIAAPHLPSPDA